MQRSNFIDKSRLFYFSRNYVAGYTQRRRHRRGKNAHQQNREIRFTDENGKGFVPYSTHMLIGRKFD
ncbi:unnamed protein product [Phyllotreta striolata]|uniref:Uncharacterized protein n=1 Tax=Phyllotreta striolata TaxID=444603 RepID=A0A9N9TS02_PHYSR|nr:unnamed protein product [Phyllotreta striolata]